MAKTMLEHTDVEKAWELRCNRDKIEGIQGKGGRESAMQQRTMEETLARLRKASGALEAELATTELELSKALRPSEASSQQHDMR